MNVLSIVVITWNRSKQLTEALNSCFACDLPEDTEFVIIDNASTDDTEVVVSSLFKKQHYEFYYEKMPENLGVGIGRNYAYLKSHGKYVYFLDDDAYIDKKHSDFFIKAIKFLDEYSQIATLTSQIYDLIWKSNRVSNTGPLYKQGLRLNYMFCGGSHFLRRSFWGNNEPYFPNKYGYEELLPSLKVVDAGYINAFAEALLVIHNPAINKWNYDDDRNANILITELASLKVMKLQLYPILFAPIISLAYWVRTKKYLSPERKESADKLVQTMKKQHSYVGKRIRISTVLKLCRDFGLTVF